MSRNVKDLDINYIFLFLKKCILYFVYIIFVTCIIIGLVYSTIFNVYYVIHDKIVFDFLYFFGIFRSFGL